MTMVMRISRVESSLLSVHEHVSRLARIDCELESVNSAKQGAFVRQVVYGELF